MASYHAIIASLQANGATFLNSPEFLTFSFFTSPSGNAVPVVLANAAGSVSASTLKTQRRYAV